jgi:predicted PurR-regulated permease PerM
MRSYSIEDTKNRLAHKHKEEFSKSNHTATVSFIGRAEFDELKQKTNALETALTDSSRYVKRISWSIRIQLLLAFLYFFVLGFIMGYGRDHSSTLDSWFSPDHNGESDIGKLKNIFDSIIVIISMYILYCIHALGQSLGYLKKKQ